MQVLETKFYRKAQMGDEEVNTPEDADYAIQRLLVSRSEIQQLFH